MLYSRFFLIRIRSVCAALVLGLCTTGAHWPFSRERYYERMNRHVFMLSTMALVSMEEASETQRVALRERGFPEAISDSYSASLVRTVRDCLREEPDATSATWFPGNDSFAALVTRTLQRVESDDAGMGPFGRLHVNQTHSRPPFVDDFYDIYHRLPQRAHSCLQDVYRTHIAAFGAPHQVDPKTDPEIAGRLNHLLLSKSYTRTVYHCTLPFHSADALHHHAPLEHTYLFVPLTSMDKADFRFSHFFYLQQQFTEEYKRDTCALAHLRRAACVIEKDPVFASHGAQSGGGGKASGPATALATLLVRVITSGVSPELEKSSPLATLLDETFGTGHSYQFSLPALLLTLEQQQCHRPRATWAPTCRGRR